MELIAALTRQNVQNRYRGSVLGVLWSLLNPLSMTIVYVAVFGSVFAPKIGGSIAGYAVSVFVGLLVVNFFTQSTTQALVALVASASLLNKVRAPFSVFPASAIMVHVVQFLSASFPILVVVTIFETYDALRVVLLVVPALSLFLLSLGVGFVVSSGYVFFRDLAYLYELLQFVVWITSPVFYPIEIIPASYRAIFELNPLYPILTAIRTLAFGSAPVPWHLLGVGLFESAVALAIGFGTIVSTRRRFMDFL